MSVGCALATLMASRHALVSWASVLRTLALLRHGGLSCVHIIAVRALLMHATDSMHTQHELDVSFKSSLVEAASMVECCSRCKA
jgi:hypothetical protein